MGFLLRLYAYVFHLILSFFLLFIAVIARLSHQNLNLGMLPFLPVQMVSRVTMISFAGLICTLLSLMGIFRFLFPVWAFVVVCLMIYGFIFSDYSFASVNAFRGALLLILGSIGAFFGALWVLKSRRRNYF